jgi:hypothetical protein
VPGGDGAGAQADRASAAADAADGDDGPALDRVIHAAETANTTLNRIVNSAAAPSSVSGFRGSLRVSAPAPARSANEGVEGTDSSAKPGKATAQPPYVASVAMLFPMEAATLFPLGQAIAGGNAFALIVVLLLIVAFIITVRYFATQQEVGGAPAYREIAVAVISFLLWVGALGGYWLEGAGGVANRLQIPADLGQKLFGFATIMWIAIVPYFVRKPGTGANA